ncbi:MAG: hypothetical protein HZB16_21610 [Armatimonadetes bacterium]|nr:hypothetical protein [Armatimonadota bacterium]
MRRQRRSAIIFGLALASALLLHGCSSGFNWSDYDQGGSTVNHQAAPLSGRYAGQLRGYGSTATYWFRLVSATEAQGVATIAGVPLDLNGPVTQANHLRLEGGDLVIEGDFRGAYHPQDSSYYEWRGVEFGATWTRPSNASAHTGAAVAYHEAWPPALHNDYDSPHWYDDWTHDSWDTTSGGGSTGGTGTDTSGGDTGGTDTGTDTGGTSGDTGGTDTGPTDGSGDTTDGGIIYRGPKGRR